MNDSDPSKIKKMETSEKIDRHDRNIIGRWVEREEERLGGGEGGEREEEEGGRGGRRRRRVDQSGEKSDSD